MILWSFVTVVYCRKISAYGVSLVSVRIVFQHLPRAMERLGVREFQLFETTQESSSSSLSSLVYYQKPQDSLGNTPGNDKCFYISGAFRFRFREIYFQGIFTCLNFSFHVRFTLHLSSTCTIKSKPMLKLSFQLRDFRQ